MCACLLVHVCEDIVLVRVSVTVKRHHDHSNSYKGKVFNWDGLHFQKFSPLSSFYICSGDGMTW